MTVQYSLIKLDATIELAQEFSASSFPHGDSTYAIEQLLRQLMLMRKRLRAANSPKLIEAAQRLATVTISDALETLGIIANSANVRNAFEVHGPVLDLAKVLLQDEKVRLILTFEWKYMPYALPVSPGSMKNLVVIGLPASEASNALVLPAVGHELGHLLWRANRKVTDRIADLVTKKANSLREGTFKDRADTLSKGTKDEGELDKLLGLSLAVDWSMRQIEEIFCDFSGLYLFGPSYLDCFEYMLEPPPMEQRDPEYPSVRQRADFLQKHGGRYRAADPKFSEKFAEQENPFLDETETDRFALDLADAVTLELVPKISDEVISLCERTIKFAPQEEVDSVAKKFKEGVPADKPGNLDAILNAAWITFKDKNFLPNAADENRIAVLNELILKTIEIFEIEKILSDAVKT